MPVGRPSPSVASSWPVAHGPSQGNILRLVKHQAIPTAVLALARGPDYMSAQVLAHLRGVATTPAPAFLQPRGTLPPGSQGLPLAAEARGTCAGKAPLRTNLQAFGLLFIVFDTTLFTQMGAVPEAA